MVPVKALEHQRGGFAGAAEHQAITGTPLGLLNSFDRHGLIRLEGGEAAVEIGPGLLPAAVLYNSLASCPALRRSQAVLSGPPTTQCYCQVLMRHIREDN